MSYRSIFFWIVFFLGMFFLFAFGITSIVNAPNIIAPTFPTQNTSSTPTRTINLKSPTSTVSPTPTPVVISPTPSIQTYEVKSGDTLEDIAQQFGTDIYSLAILNKIADPNLIYAGKILSIPPSTLPTYPTPNGPISTTIDKHIYVVLSEQKVYAYEGDQLIASFLVSSGLPDTPTVTGNYKIKTKLLSDDMEWPGLYYLEDVPWVMYFFEGYSFHGTTWHNNFGHPMSHGCLNMSVSDAEWLFNWSNVGTPVKIDA